MACWEDEDGTNAEAATPPSTSGARSTAASSSSQFYFCTFCTWDDTGDNGRLDEPDGACAMCGTWSASDIGTCPNCRVPVCGTCATRICDSCGKSRVCGNCTHSCPACKRTLCDSCSERCERCFKAMCESSDCGYGTTKCQRCGRKMCIDCVDLYGHLCKMDKGRRNKLVLGPTAMGQKLSGTIRA